MVKSKTSPLHHLFLLLLLFCEAGCRNTAADHEKKATETNTQSNSGTGKAGLKKIVFIAGGCSHGPGEHEYKAGCMLLADALRQNMPGKFEVVGHHNTWPSAPGAFENAAAIILFVTGGQGHMALNHLEELETLMQKGVGLACLHYAVEVPKEIAGTQFLNWLGGYFEINWSVNPVWLADFKSLPAHPITRGVQPFMLTDEWYYHMRFREHMQGITPILTAIPPASTLNRPDGTHQNNPFVRAEKGRPQHVAWATVRDGGGRSFGFTGGHFHKNWTDDNYRRLVLNAILWIAKEEVPVTGFPITPLPAATLQANLDNKPCP